MNPVILPVNLVNPAGAPVNRIPHDAALHLRLCAVHIAHHEHEFGEEDMMRFRIEDTNYDWEPGGHAVEIMEIREWVGQYGPALRWTFCEPGRPIHRVTGMTSTSCSPNGKLVNWFLAATGHELAAIRDSELDTTDAIGALVTVHIEPRDGPNGPRSFVTAILPAQPNTAATSRPPPESREEDAF